MSPLTSARPRQHIQGKKLNQAAISFVTSDQGEDHVGDPEQLINITSSLPIGSILAPVEPHFQGHTDQAPQADRANQPQEQVSQRSPIAVDHAASRLLAAASSHERARQEAGPPTKSDQPPAARMRSSIACARCRRSKVKCVNNGVGTTCRACETTGRECTYPVPVPSAGSSARRESNESQHSKDAGQQHDVCASRWWYDAKLMIETVVGALESQG